MFYQAWTVRRPPKGPQNAVFLSLVTLTYGLWPWPSNSSERGTKRVFLVNLAEIRAAVPEIFHTQIQQVLINSWDGRPFGHNRHGPKIGVCVPFGELGLHVTQCSLGAAYHRTMAFWSVQPFGHNRHGLKIGGSVPFLGRRARGPRTTQYRVGWGLPAYQVTSSSIQPFGHSRHGPNTGVGCAPFWGEGAGSPSNTMLLGWGLPHYQVTSWSIQAFSHNRHGPKIFGAVPFWERGSWVPI